MSSLGVYHLTHSPDFIRYLGLLSQILTSQISRILSLYCCNPISGFNLIGYHKYFLISPLDTAGEFIRVI